MRIACMRKEDQIFFQAKQRAFRQELKNIRSKLMKQVLWRILSPEQQNQRLMIYLLEQ